MPSNALSCIVCNRELWNVEMGAENQPNEGTAFTSHGHYGSTAFDPMDGSFIEITVCDTCLRKAGHEKKVLLNRSHRPVLAQDPEFNAKVLVGMEKVNREYTYWKPDMVEKNPEERRVGWDEVGLLDEEYEDITWLTGGEE